MRFVRLAIIGLLLLFLFATGISLLIPSRVIISRATNLAPGRDSILREINDLARWKNWYPGFGQTTLTGIKKVNGKIVEANANGIKLTIAKSSERQVDVDIQKGDRPVLTHWQLIRHSVSDTLTLRSYYEFGFKWYPWEKLAGLLLEKTYGPVIEQGLKNLKERQ
jgi:hypothetical protein